MDRARIEALLNEVREGHTASAICPSRTLVSPNSIITAPSALACPR